MTSFQNDSLFQRILYRIPPHVAQTFTSEQIATCKLKADRHAIDIRLTIPFLGKGFYVVALAGLERRSKKRLRTESPNYFLKAFVAVGLTSTVAVLVLVGLFSLTELIATQPAEISHPTAIPWINNEAECRHTNRTWRENKCWDGEWSHRF
ncbi:MAG: hypothetical protein MUF49_07245 [Oculatellaceae cyanobacterium Prado106]|nr:hypothetical protein [Oculatellaceae cyanobacterium Prado106]